MDYSAVVLALLLYFIRPQDWVPGLIGVGIVTPVLLVVIYAMYSRTRSESKPLRLIRTPQDWAMLTYYAYIILTSTDPVGTFKGAFSLYAFYFATTIALDTTEKLKRYLHWWLFALVVIAFFGVASLYGFDPTGAVSMTQSQKGRLALGTWMHNNPNALGHSVVLILPLAYLLLFWKSGMGGRVKAICFCLLAFECVWQTQSKGAVLSGFVMLVLAYVFGKSKVFQILVLTVALAGGGAAISVMPRMDEMGSLRNDEGVQGRLLAWDQARTVKNNNLTGVGWKTYKARIRWEKLTISKATHSGYVQVGAEMGPIGMILYVGILWLGFRTLIRCGQLDLEAERCRRCIFALLIGFVISNWMIDHAYHLEFFLVMATTSALHRMRLLDGDKVVAQRNIEPDSETWTPPILSWGLTPKTVLANGSAMLNQNMAVLDQVPSAEFATSKSIPKNRSANYPDFVDLIMAIAGAWLVFFIWDYVLRNL